MDEINKLIKRIEDKDIKNSKFEIEQNELEEDVRQTEKHICQKIKILRRHLEEKEKYGTKLQQNIETLHKQRKQLTEEVLDRVCIIHSLKNMKLLKYTIDTLIYELHLK